MTLNAQGEISAEIETWRCGHRPHVLRRTDIRWTQNEAGDAFRSAESPPEPFDPDRYSLKEVVAIADGWLDERRRSWNSVAQKCLVITIEPSACPDCLKRNSR